MKNQQKDNSSANRLSANFSENKTTTSAKRDLHEKLEKYKGIEQSKILCSIIESQKNNRIKSKMVVWCLYLRILNDCL